MCSGKAYGCLYCRSNMERTVIERMEKWLPNVRGIVACKEKHKKVNGQKERVTDIFLPGYVFFEAPSEMISHTFYRQPFVSKAVIRVLTDSEGNWQLKGDDEQFALWLFRYAGLLHFSRAYQEGDRIRIVSGPLKDVEGKMIRVDKRGQCGLIQMMFNHTTITTWLGFEMIDSLEPSSDLAGQRIL